MKKITTVVAGALTLFLSAVSFVHAQAPFDNPLRARSIIELLEMFLRGLVYIGTIALMLAFVWTGFLFVMAQGAEEKIKDARRTLMWTLIGGLVLIGAQGIAVIINASVSSIY